MEYRILDNRPTGYGGTREKYEVCDLNQVRDLHKESIALLMAVAGTTTHGKEKWSDCIDGVGAVMVESDKTLLFLDDWDGTGNWQSHIKG